MKKITGASLKNLKSKVKVSKARKDSVLKKSDSILSRTNPDGSISVLHYDQEEYVYLIDGISADVFKLINGKYSLAQIQTRVIKKHKPPAAVFEKDFNTFIKWLVKEKIISS